MSQGPTLIPLIDASNNLQSNADVLALRAPMAGRVRYFGWAVETAPTGDDAVLTLSIGGDAKTPTVDVLTTTSAGDVLAGKAPEANDEGWLVEAGDEIAIESDGGPSGAGAGTAFVLFEPIFLDANASNVTVS